MGQVHRYPSLTEIQKNGSSSENFSYEIQNKCIQSFAREILFLGGVKKGRAGIPSINFKGGLKSPSSARL